MKFRLIKIVIYNMEENNNSIIKAPGINFVGGKSPLDSNLSLESLPSEVKLRQIKDFTTFEVSVYVPSSDATNAALYPVFYVATVPCFLIEAKLRHDVNGTSTIVDVEKLTAGIAKGSGGSMLVSKFDLSTGARTTISKLVTIATSGYQLNSGDAVALRATGTLTNTSAVCVTLLFGLNLRDIPTGSNL